MAEAVNFAMEEWLEAGKEAVPCTCSCLPDGVALDMAIFCPELRESSGGRLMPCCEAAGEVGWGLRQSELRVPLLRAVPCLRAMGEGRQPVAPAWFGAPPLVPPRRSCPA